LAPITKQQAEAMEKMRHGKVQKPTFLPRLQIPQKRGIRTFPPLRRQLLAECIYFKPDTSLA
jgi:hypothetical protein